MISTFWRLRQEKLELKTSLGYMMISCPEEEKEEEGEQEEGEEEKEEEGEEGEEEDQANEERRHMWKRGWRRVSYPLGSPYFANEKAISFTKDTSSPINWQELLSSGSQES